MQANLCYNEVKGRTNMDEIQIRKYDKLDNDDFLNSTITAMICPNTFSNYGCFNREFQIHCERYDGKNHKRMFGFVFAALKSYNR